MSSGVKLAVRAANGAEKDVTVLGDGTRVRIPHLPTARREVSCSSALDEARRQSSVDLRNEGPMAAARWGRDVLMDATSSTNACPFCAIVAGRAPAREVLRTDEVVAFLPDVPAVLGHTLVIPADHLSNIWEVGTQESYFLADATRRVAAAVADATNAEGMNIIQSNGLAAGQSVFHLHVHVVPRKVGDRMPALWPEDAEWSGIQLDSVAEDIRVTINHH